MSPMKDRFLLVLHHGVILLLLTHSCEGQSQMIGPTQPVVAMIGDDIILPCHLEPAVNAVDLTVEWSRNDLKPRFVYVRRDGVELLTEQNSLYTRRTSLSVNKLQCGDISLKLSKVQLSDAGTYKCFVPKCNAESVMELAVGSVSSPIIEISKVRNKVVLECKSNGWYPAPQVLWLNSGGNIISAESTKNVRGSDGLYTVSSTVTVEKRQSFTCRVQQKNINQTKEAHIHVSGDLFMAQSNPAVRITITLAVSFISAATMIFLICKLGQNKTKTKRHTQDESELGEREMRMKEGQKEKESVNKAKLELQNTEEALLHIQQVIAKLVGQKTSLKKQREILNSLLQEDNTQMKEIQKKLDKPPKVGKEKKKQKRGNAKQDLETRQKNHKELLQGIEDLAEGIEEIMIGMTERKGELEKDKKDITEHLKETKETEDTKLFSSQEEDGNNQQLSNTPG